jgi:hypothetical protein
MATPAAARGVGEAARRTTVMRQVDFGGQDGRELTGGSVHCGVTQAAEDRRQ